MSNGSGATRGDRRQNARKARLRALVPVGNAMAGVDLAERNQTLAVVSAETHYAIASDASAEIAAHATVSR
jgi:transposase